MEKDYMSFQGPAALYVLQIIFSPFIFFHKVSCVLTNKCNQDAEELTRIRKTSMSVDDLGCYISPAFPCMGPNGYCINPGCYAAG